MSGVYKKILIITLLLNVVIFGYYWHNSDINPSIDAFYYGALADSLYNGTGLANVTTSPPQPIYTPQNGIVFLHLLLEAVGIHDLETRLLAIKLINYAGFLLLIYIFYVLFRRLQVSPEITCLSLGILLSGAHFFKTIDQPLNEGLWCLVTAIVLYLAITNEEQESWLNIGAIALSGIVLANFRLNGPVIILSIGAAYVLLRAYKKSIIYFIIFIVSYLSVYIILAILKADCSGFKTFSSVYSYDFIVNRPLMTLIYTVPGAFLGITASGYMQLFYTAPKDALTVIGKWLVMLPFTILLFIFYGLYLRKYFQAKSFAHLLIISYLILLVAILQLMPGGDSRYIIMILPFTLLAIGTYFPDGKILRLFLGLFLIFTIAVSLFRMCCWDNIYFANNKSCAHIRKTIHEPYVLISEFPKISYFIWGKPSIAAQDIPQASKNIVVFGTDDYNNKIINLVSQKYGIERIDHLNDAIITGHGPGSIFNTIKIAVK
jgi:hypothetical protein